MVSPARADITQERLAAINADSLTPLVRQALNQPDVVVTQWRYAQLQGGVGGGTFGSAIYRFEGDTQEQGAALAWALILKVLYRQDDQALTDSHYWKREALAYQSEWLS